MSEHVTHSRSSRVARRLLAAVACAMGMASSASIAPAQVSPTQIARDARVRTNRPIDFHAGIYPETVYVGQQATYQIAVFISDEARPRLRRNPEFTPPEIRGLLAYEIGTPRTVPRASYGGRAYDAVVFQRAMFPVKVGPIAIPSPKLDYTLYQTQSYFSRDEQHSVTADSARLVVRALPAEGRPDSFTGGVGVLTMTMRVDSTGARVGDPLVLTLRVQGTGNVKLLPRPLVEIPWAGAVAGTERVIVDTTGALVRGAKEFDWILTPTRQGRVTVPALRYDYFDPYKGAYAIAITEPLEIPIGAGALAAADLGESAALLPLRGDDDGAPAWALQRLAVDEPAVQWGALFVALLAPLPALVLLVRRRRSSPARARTARGAGGDPLATLATLGTLSAAGDDGAARARAARRVLHGAIADRLGVDPGAMVSRRGVRRLLRRRGVTREGTETVLRTLHELDTRGFAGHEPGDVPDERLARESFRIVDEEAVRGDGSGIPGSRDLRTIVAIVGLPLAAALVPWPSAQAQQAAQQAAQDVAPASAAVGTTGPADDFAAARRQAAAAYRQRQFQDAVARYAELVARAPRDAGLLADWGTAAWASADTVSAVVAWQRAARLDPLAADIQERVALLPAGARGGVADVPMVPVSFLAALALLTWTVGWFALAWRLRDATGARNGVVAPALAWTCLTVAVTSAGLAVWGARALDASALAVVLRPETMHVAPAADSDAMGGVTTGDVVRRLGGEGAWQRVLHADGRTGWLPAARLVPVAPVADAVPGATIGRDTIGVSAVPLTP